MALQLINADQVKSLLTMEDTLKVCEETFKGWGDGTVLCPPKIHLELGSSEPWPPYKNDLHAMPAYIDSTKTAGLKCISGSLNNPGWGLPYSVALILLFHPATGIFYAMVEGERITSYRTGAQAAVAAKYLQQKSSLSLGLCGAGAQGHTQILAFSKAFDLKKVVLYDIAPEKAQQCVQDMAPLVSCPIEIATAPEQVFSGTDVVVSVTHSRDKFIQKDWMQPGQLLLPLGARECSDELLLSVDRIIVDSVGQTLSLGALKSLASQGKITAQSLAGTVGDLVCGKIPAMGPQEKVVCVTVGMGALDVAVAAMIYQKALDAGMELPSWVYSSDVEIDLTGKI